MSIKESVLAAYNQTRDFSQKSLHAACYAPWVSLYFDTQGNVQACCQNTKFPLGNVAYQTIDEIWKGKKIASLRKALAKDNFAAGCQFCEWQISVGNYLGTFTRNFELLPVLQEEPEWPSMMEFSISNTCNLECIMCNGTFSSSIRARREGLPPLLKPYSDDFFNELRKYLPHLKFAKFLGGEPFLAQETLRIWDMMIEDGLKIPCHVTTNGTQWNSRVERVLEHIPCSFSISMDGFTKQTVESIRVNAPFELVRENFLKFLAYARARGTYIGLTYCLMVQNWHEFGDYLLFADEHDCEVVVNTVREPPHCSLYRLPVEDLAKIVDSLEKQGEELLPRLGRNRNVWDTHVSALRLRVENERESARAPFKSPLSLYIIDLPGLDAVPVERRMTVERAEKELRQWAGSGQVVRFSSDADDRIREVHTTEDHFFGIPIDECVGERFVSVVDDMRSRLGTGIVVDLFSTGEHVDRLIDFQEADRLFVVRLISIPVLNDFGLHGGSHAVAIGRYVSPTSDKERHEAEELLREWGDGQPILTLHRDQHDIVHSLDPKDVEAFGLNPSEWTGKHFQDLAPLIMRDLKINGELKDHWVEKLTLHRVDRYFVFQSLKSALMIRELMIRQFDSNGHFLGWTTLLTTNRMSAENQSEYLLKAEARLRQSHPEGVDLRIECNLDDVIESVDSPELAGVPIDDLVGRPVVEIATRLIERHGAFHHRRLDNGVDQLMTFTPKRCRLVIRAAILPRYGNALRVGSTQLLRIDLCTIEQLRSLQDSIRNALRTEFPEGQLFHFSLTKEGIVTHMDSPDFAGLPSQEIIGRDITSLGEYLSRRLETSPVPKHTSSDGWHSQWRVEFVGRESVATVHAASFMEYEFDENTTESKLILMLHESKAMEQMLAGN